eukprot:TRINITY_DN24091_c0_g1_i1.p1 TRINITY_DN24091_c0_g1~~TRINITY_DN24091_c0_g1_i1.p1  ORF type:complete len:189 (-),score=21.67 TRINITY_DN24091_c0_g1_i1:100-666(-)
MGKCKNDTSIEALILMNDTILLAALTGGIISLWVMPQAQFVKQWQAQTGFITYRTICKINESEIIVGSGKDKIIKLWNINEIEKSKIDIKFESECQTLILFDQSKFVSAHFNGDINLYDFKNNVLLLRTNTDNYNVLHMIQLNVNQIAVISWKALRILQINQNSLKNNVFELHQICLLYTSPSPRDQA